MSPTIMTKSVMLSCMIDTREQWDVATVDIAGAFMQTNLEEKVHIWLKGAMAELLLKIDPNLYNKYLVWEGKKTVMYAELTKALYGTLDTALLFWKNLSAKLESWGYEQNPYDWCVVNKKINGKQCKILWHVDDLKILHIDPNVVDGMLK